MFATRFQSVGRLLTYFRGGTSSPYGSVAALFVLVSLGAMSVSYSATGLPLAEGGCVVCIP